MRLELIRHGETALQKEHRYQGITDAPLSPEGRGKLHPAGALPERVIVTPLQRTRETADILFPGLPQLVIPPLILASIAPSVICCSAATGEMALILFASFQTIGK